MHLHLWEEGKEEDDGPVVDVDLVPGDVYPASDEQETGYIQWTATTVIDGKTYAVELRQAINVR